MQTFVTTAVMFTPKITANGLAMNSKNTDKMEKTLQLIKNFEKRNNISIAVTFYGDGSGTVSEFWDYEELKEFKTIDDLHTFLMNTQYKLADEDGRCLFPVQEV